MVLTKELRNALLQDEIASIEQAIGAQKAQYESLINQMESLREQRRQIGEQANEIYRVIEPSLNKLRNLKLLIES
jgi:hypothetical protein